MLITER